VSYGAAMSETADNVRGGHLSGGRCPSTWGKAGMSPLLCDRIMAYEFP